MLKFDNFAALFFQRLFFRNQPLIAFSYQGIKYTVDTSAGDLNGIEPCLFGDMYRSFVKRANLPQNPTIADIGANAGGFALMLAHMKVTPKKLISVEMNPRTCARLKANLGSNLMNATAVNAAIVGTARTIEIDPDQASTGQSIYQAGGKGVSEVQGIPFDTFIETNFGNEPIDLCKMDIEGAEYEILLPGFANRLSQVKTLIIEIHRQAGKSPQDIIDFLVSSGLRLLDQNEDVYFFSR